MCSNRQAVLQRRILMALHETAEACHTWLRFVAMDEARRAGGTPRDAEEALRRLHDEGYVALAFGYERGGLTKAGEGIAERMARHA